MAPEFSRIKTGIENFCEYSQLFFSGDDCNGSEKRYLSEQAEKQKTEWAGQGDHRSEALREIRSAVQSFQG